MPANEITVAELLAELEREYKAMLSAIPVGGEKDRGYWENYHGGNDRRMAVHIIKQTLAAMEARNAND